MSTKSKKRKESSREKSLENSESEETLEQKVASLKKLEKKSEKVSKGDEKKNKDGENEKDLLKRLIIALHCSDKLEINNILDITDTLKIQTALEEFPLQLVVPLLKEIEARLNEDKKKDLLPLLKWVNEIFSAKMTFIASNPSIASELKTLKQFAHSRLRHRDKMLKLAGKMRFLNAQIRASRGTGFQTIGGVPEEEPKPAVSMFDESDDEVEVEDSPKKEAAEEASGDEEEALDDWWIDKGRQQGSDNELSSDEKSDGSEKNEEDDQSMDHSDHDSGEDSDDDKDVEDEDIPKGNLFGDSDDSDGETKKKKRRKDR